MEMLGKRKKSIWEILLLLILWLLFIYYIRNVLELTLLDRTPGVRRRVLSPFWETRMFLKGNHRRYWAEQILGNLVMLYPLGIFLPTLLPWMRKGTRTVAAGFLCSCAIELTQYYTGLGLLESDDLIHNTLGAWGGYLTFAVMYHLYRKIIRKE